MIAVIAIASVAVILGGMFLGVLLIVAVGVHKETTLRTPARGRAARGVRELNGVWVRNQAPREREPVRSGDRYAA